MPTGMDLKLQRVRQRVTAKALAERAGWKSHARVSQIESLAIVQPETADRYLSALRTFPEVTTPSENVA